MRIKSLLQCVALIALFIAPKGYSSVGVEHFEFPKDGVLTSTMLDYYHDKGFLVMDHFMSSQECGALIDDIGKMLGEFELTPDKVEVFTAKNNDTDANRGKYFRESVDKAFPFFEEGAIQDGKLVDSIVNCTNKIGHAVAETRSAFGGITFTQPIHALLEGIGVANPVVPQSMIIMKPKIRGGIVDPHQDATFLYTTDNTTVAMWTPLHDATATNGCLEVIPGSHKWPLLSRWVKDSESDQMKFIDQDGKDLKDASRQALYEKHWDPNAFVPVPMKKGSVLFFPGTLVHRSSNNTSQDPRNAYTCHFVASGGDNYPKNNWLQRKDGFKRVWQGK